MDLHLKRIAKEVKQGYLDGYLFKFNQQCIALERGAGGGHGPPYKSWGQSMFRLCINIKVVSQLILSTFSFRCFMDSLHRVLLKQLPPPQLRIASDAPD